MFTCAHQLDTKSVHQSLIALKYTFTHFVQGFLTERSKSWEKASSVKLLHKEYIKHSQ